MKCGCGLTQIWKSWQNKCGRRARSFEVLNERKYGKRNFRSLVGKAEQKCGSGTSHLGSPGRDEMRKWTFPYFEVLVEQVRKKNEIFRSPGRAEVRKAELLIFGNKDRAELRTQRFRPLKVLAEQDLCAEAELHIVGSQDRTEVQKRESRISDLWQSYQVGSVEAELYIFDRSLTY